MDSEAERRFCLETAWSTVRMNGEWVRANPKVRPVREEGLRAVIWRLMVGSHAK
jgi:hypothetical protein